MKQLTLISIIFLLMSCSALKKETKNYKQTLNGDYSFVLEGITTDKTYGYSKKNAIEVGGSKDSEGPKNERRFLNSLSGPNGEKISYYREGSCCPVKSENGFMGSAMLDIYRVNWEGSDDTLSLYINMYDSSKLYAPIGFGIR